MRSSACGVASGSADMAPFNYNRATNLGGLFYLLAETPNLGCLLNAVEEVLDLEDMPEATIDRWEEGSAPLDKIAQAFALGPPAKVLVDRLSNFCGRPAR